MNLIRSPKNSKTLFHVSLSPDDEKIYSEIRSLQTLPNISNIVKDETESSKLVNQSSGSQGQQLDHSSGLPDIQRPFSTHFFSQHGNSLVTRLQSEEICNSRSLSSSNSAIPNLVGYWPATPLHTGFRSDSHVLQQYPYLVFQQQLPSPFNTRLEQHCFSPQVTTHFPLSLYSSYLSQTNSDSFGTNRQPQPADKFPSLPLTPSPLYQLHDNNNLTNCQSYLQLSPLHTTHPPMGSISYNSAEYSGCHINNQPVFSDLASENDITSQSYTQLLSLNHSFPPKQSKSDYLLPTRSKSGNSFSSRPFKCDLCFQSFNRNHDLKRHKRIHLAIKPFPCPSCEKCFSRKDALKRHILVKGCIG